MCSVCRDLALFIRRDPRMRCGRRRGPRHVRVTPLGLRRLQTSERLRSHLTSSWRVRRPPLRRFTCNAKHVCARAFVIRWRSVDGGWFFSQMENELQGKKRNYRRWSELYEFKVGRLSLIFMDVLCESSFSFISLSLRGLFPGDKQPTKHFTNKHQHTYKPATEAIIKIYIYRETHQKEPSLSGLSFRCLMTWFSSRVGRRRLSVGENRA